MYKISTGKYPARFEDLWTRPGNAPKWQGPYLDDVPPTPKDPWGHEYTYTPPVGSSEFLITSQGEGDEGATAITNKNLRQVLDSKGI
jgi:general secretion pathway protein G